MLKLPFPHSPSLPFLRNSGASASLQHHACRQFLLVIMFTSLRIFRPMAALMAALLLLSGSLPLVQHACAMAQRHEQAREHPCPQHAHDEAPTHHGMHAHGSMHAASQAEPPCTHDEQQPAAPGECCIVEAAPAVTANGVRALKRSLTPAVVLAAAVADVVPSSDRGVSHTLFFDTGPPPQASVSLHVVHSVFLN